jgi:hypothetical protein
MASTEPRNPVTLNSENLTRHHSDALMYCIQELNREHPDFQAAQVYATLSLEEALRDLAQAVGRAAGDIARFM